MTTRRHRASSSSPRAIPPFSEINASELRIDQAKAWRRRRRRRYPCGRRVGRLEGVVPGDSGRRLLGALGRGRPTRTVDVVVGLLLAAPLALAALLSRPAHDVHPVHHLVLGRCCNGGGSGPDTRKSEMNACMRGGVRARSGRTGKGQLSSIAGPGRACTGGCCR